MPTSTPFGALILLKVNYKNISTMSVNLAPVTLLLALNTHLPTYNRVDSGLNSHKILSEAPYKTGVTQLAITCSRLIETLEKSVKSV